MESDFAGARDLEGLTGIKASTWRYWAMLGGAGPSSFRLGRRRLWRKSEVMAWIAAQEAATTTAGDASEGPTTDLASRTW